MRPKSERTDLAASFLQQLAHPRPVGAAQADRGLLQVAAAARPAVGAELRAASWQADQGYFSQQRCLLNQCTNLFDRHLRQPSDEQRKRERRGDGMAARHSKTWELGASANNYQEICERSAAGTDMSAGATIDSAS